MWRALILLLVLPSLPRAEETVVTGISRSSYSLNASLDGSELFIFGAVRRDAPIPEDAGPLDVVITVRGPEQDVTVRRKSRKLGIWVNTEAVEVLDAPSYYAIASSGPLDLILSESERLRYNVGMDHAVRRIASHPKIASARPFTDAMVRLREKSKLYTEEDGDVSLTEETLFQVALELPANLVEGDYTAEFFLIRNRRVMDRGTKAIVVEKTGLGRWLYNLSQDMPFLYGLLSVALALVAGWTAATAFRLARRR